MDRKDYEYMLWALGVCTRSGWSVAQYYTNRINAMMYGDPNNPYAVY